MDWLQGPDWISSGNWLAHFGHLWLVVLWNSRNNTQHLIFFKTTAPQKTDLPDQIMVSKLIPGVYEFELTVTDSADHSDSDKVTVLVLTPEQSERECYLWFLLFLTTPNFYLLWMWLRVSHCKWEANILFKSSFYGVVPLPVLFVLFEMFVCLGIP